METVVVLLIVMGFVGAFDGLYYHLYKFRLYRQPSARTETVTHLVRGALFAVVLWTLAHYAPAGGWYWSFIAVFAVELTDDVIDVLIEPASRKPLGGLPRFEYLVHMIVMAISGGIWVAFAISLWPSRLAPTELIPHGADFLSPLLVWIARLVALSALFLTVFEGALLVRSWTPSDRSVPEHAST